MISLFVLVLIGQAMAFDIVKLIEDSKYTAGTVRKQKKIILPQI